MRSFAIVAGLFAVATLAKPVNVVARGETDPCDEEAPPCMTFDEATVVADNFRLSIVNYSNATTIEHFTPDFVDYSASVNTLINGGCSGPVDVSSRVGLPLSCSANVKFFQLNGPTFSSRVEFMAGQGSQPTM